jgi:hypothetical protein
MINAENIDRLKVGAVVFSAPTPLFLFRVLFGIFIELLLAGGRTKIIGSSLIFGLPGGVLFADLHAANRIFLHNYLQEFLSEKLPALVGDAAQNFQTS